MAADRAGREVVLPAGAGEVAADDALDRQHLEPAALGRAAVVAQREQVVRDELARRANQNAERPVSTRPLSGISVGQDDVERRDPVARDEQQPVVVERVELADLAAPTCVRLQTWTGSSFGTRACRRSKTRVDVRDGRVEVEDVVERGGVEPRRDLGVGARRASRKSRSSSHACIALRCTSRYASARSSPASTSASRSRCEKKSPCDASRFRAHALRVDDEAVDDPGEAVEHVVEREERVGDDDPLGGRVRDVALVPERHVLEADRGRGADDAREAADPLGDLRVALVRHRRRALHARRERLLDLAHLGAREVPDLGREAVERGRADRERGEQLGVAVARDHLRRDRIGLEPEPLAGDPLDLGVDRRVRPDRAGELADAA